MSDGSLEAHAKRAGEVLSAAIPEPVTELAFANGWELLVATILSAQSTDKTVNRVTPVLFERWPEPADLAEAPLEVIEEVVHSTGFFRRKAKAIQGAARAVRDRFGGEVPRDLDALVTLPGVARKTANLVLGSAYGLATGMVVDTHARRVAQRLGLTDEDKPDRVEADLCALWAPGEWIDMSHRLILHGRYVCTARSPKCVECPLNELCPSAKAPAKDPRPSREDWERRFIDSVGPGEGSSP